MAIDIDQSYYATGTATVDAGGTVVTGQGTQWSAAVRKGDIFGTHVGMPVRILSVDSDTQLTLAYPWKGDAQAAAAYEIQFTPYKSGYQEAVRQLLLTLGNGNLQALAGLAFADGKLIGTTGEGTATLVDYSPDVLADANESLAGLAGLEGVVNLLAFAALTGAADKLPFFTSEGEMDVTALTEFARSLLDDADGPAMLTTLGALPAAGGTATGNVIFSNAKIVMGKSTGGTNRSLATVWNDDRVKIGDTNVPIDLQGTEVRPKYNGGGLARYVETVLDVRLGTITAQIGDASTSGWKDAPAGTVVTSAYFNTSPGAITAIRGKPVQVNNQGTWYTIGG